jgi:membrane-bound serine protease (ClpP class)
MEPMQQWYIVLLVGGLLMLGAEIYVPGGILGLVGSFCLLSAIAIGFAAFGAQWGMLSAFMIIMAAGICIVVWIKYFPRTHVGRSLTLSKDGRNFKATEEWLPALQDKEGTAQTTLRPAGIATIDGQRVDVIAEGDWIQAGARIKVIKVEGNVITVCEIPDSEA